MRTTELIKHISDETGLSESDCNKVLNSLFRISKEVILKGHRLKFRNFGSFILRKKKNVTRKGFGKTFEVELSKRVKFTPSDNLTINKSFKSILEKLADDKQEQDS